LEKPRKVPIIESTCWIAFAKSYFRLVETVLSFIKVQQQNLTKQLFLSPLCKQLLATLSPTVQQVKATLPKSTAHRMKQFIQTTTTTTP